MKKLLLMTAFLLPMMANAQYGSLVEQPTGGNWGSIVRIWQDSNKVLSYGGLVIGQQSISAICLSDYSQFYSPTPSTPVLSMVYANLHAAPWNTVNPRFTSINDMRIVDDIAFVCGSAVDTNYPTVAIGAIGWFRLSDFSSPNSTLYFHYYMLPAVKYAKKLVAYPCGMGYTVLALAENNNYDYFFEVREVTIDQNPYMDFRLFNAYSFFDKEAYDDILVSGNEVFIVGQNRSSGDRQLCIRKANRDGVLQDPQFGYRYDFIVPTNEINAETRSTLIDDKTIATVYVHPLGTMSFSTRLRLIRTTTMDMINSQEMIKDEKWEPVEMIFLNTHSELVLLQQIGKYYSFTMLYPLMNTAYTTNYLFHPDREFYSLDGDYDKLFVSTGSDNYLYFQRLGMFLPSPTRCPNNESIIVKPIENAQKGVVSDPLRLNYNTSEIRITMHIDTILSQQICNSPLNVK